MRSLAKKICGANKSDGTICQKPPAKGRNRCRHHGGATPRGTDSPHFIHGRKSRFLPQRWEEDAAAAEADAQELLSTRKDAALWEAIVRERLRRIGSGDSRLYREELLDLWMQFKTVSQDKSLEEAERVAESGKLIAAIGKKIESGASDEVQVQELLEAQRTRKEFVEAEISIMRVQNMMVPVEQVLGMFGMFAMIVREVVTDRGQQARIGERLEKLLPGSSIGSGAGQVQQPIEVEPEQPTLDDDASEPPAAGSTENPQ